MIRQCMNFLFCVFCSFERTVHMICVEKSRYNYFTVFMHNEFTVFLFKMIKSMYDGLLAQFIINRKCSFKIGSLMASNSLQIRIHEKHKHTHQMVNMSIHVISIIVQSSRYVNGYSRITFKPRQRLTNRKSTHNNSFQRVLTYFLKPVRRHYSHQSQFNEETPTNQKKCQKSFQFFQSLQ